MIKGAPSIDSVLTGGLQVNYKQNIYVMSTVKENYVVEGMTCSGCERAVQGSVGSVEGVVSAKADAPSSTVSVEYDPGKVNVDQIRSAVAKVGYKFVGVQPE